LFAVSRIETTKTCQSSEHEYDMLKITTIEAYVVHTIQVCVSWPTWFHTN